MTHRIVMSASGRTLTLVGLLAFLIAGMRPGFADYDAGVEAYTKGDYAAAIAEWQDLAEAGDPDSQFGMALIHESGRGVGRDYREAVRWYTAAAEQGHSASQFNLGHLLRLGAGTEPDMEGAVRWWTAAAESGLPQAQVMLGLAYQRGEGVEPDLQESILWFLRAAELGDPMGQYAMGYAYETGTGLLQDLDQARYYYERAAASGVEQAIDRLTALSFAANGEEPPPPPREGDVMARMASNVAEAGSERDMSLEGAEVEGQIYIQLAAYLDQGRAEHAWMDFERKHEDVLGGLPYRVAKVERDGSEAVYRLQAGPLPDAVEAETICGLLKERDAECFLVRE
jgi:hypothetical protein